jgi:hypothetical protein
MMWEYLRYGVRTSSVWYREIYGMVLGHTLNCIEKSTVMCRNNYGIVWGYLLYGKRKSTLW